MRISNILFAAVLSCCVLGSLSAASSAKQMKRHYIQQQNLRVTKEGIAIKAKGKVIRAKAIHHDSKGLYVLKKDCVAVEKGWEETGWTDGSPYCNDCGFGFRDQGAFDYHNDCCHNDNNFDRP